MKKVLRFFFKWLLRLFLAVIGLFLLVIILFVMLRKPITNKVVSIANEQQEGVFELGSLNLRPFIRFPDVSLKLNHLRYSEDAELRLDADSISILDIEEIYVSMDVIQLLKGKYEISRIDLGEGEINYVVGKDSVSNIERALGIRFGTAAPDDTATQDTSSMYLNLELLQIRNLALNFTDQSGNSAINLVINGLQSGFSYELDQIKAFVRSNIDIPYAKYQDILIDKPRTISFSSDMNYNRVSQVIDLEKTVLDITDALFELDGSVLLAQNQVNMNFMARNTGIDLLNFMLAGVLDMDEISQIGDGRMQISGTVNGSYKEGLPLVNMNFTAQDLGFRIHSIGEEVSDIGFTGFATNGSKPDLSGAALNLKDFHVTLPGGAVDFDLAASNLLKPNIDLSISGDVDLSIVERIIKTNAFSDLEGSISVYGDVKGAIDKSSGVFLENAGELVLGIHEAGLKIPGHRFDNMNGELYVDGKNIGLRSLEVLADSNQLYIESQVDYLLPYLMGFSVNPTLSLSFASPELNIDALAGDTILGAPLKDLEFRMDLNATATELEAAIREGSIPRMNLVFQDLKFQYPEYAPVSGINILLILDQNALTLSKFEGNIGESDFDIEAAVKNYQAYLNNDSTAEIEIDLGIKARKLLAKDLLTYQGNFLILPPEFEEEVLQQFKFKGKLKTSVSELLSDKPLPDFKFTANEMEWQLKQYAYPFKDFQIDIEHRGAQLLINSFRGKIGESNLDLQAELYNLLDTAQIIKGDLSLASDLLDLDQLLDYALLQPPPSADSIAKDTSESKSSDLHKIEFPDLELNLKIGEFKFEQNHFYAIDGKVRLRNYHVIYLDKFSFISETGGSVLLDGQFNLIDSNIYTLSANLEIDSLNISDFDVKLAIEDTIYTLEDNFNGILSADGIAEIFVNPDLTVNVDTSTAIFNVHLQNGRVKEFAPLKAIARYTGNKDLDNVQFGELRNSFTLSDGVIEIPLMNISSTLGLILLEGEQGLDGEMLYLVRVPPSMIRGTAWNVISNQQRKDPKEEEEVQTMKTQKFAKVTVWSKGEEMEVKIGDERDKYQ